MRHRANEVRVSSSLFATWIHQERSSLVWVIFFALLLAGMAAGAVLGHAMNEQLQTPLIAGATAVAGVLAFSAVMITSAQRDATQTENGAQHFFESAGALLIAIGRNGVLSHLNAMAEHTLGPTVSESTGARYLEDLFAPGELDRIAGELLSLCGLEAPTGHWYPEPQHTLMTALAHLPAGTLLPTFETLLRRPDGETVPVLLQLSAARNRKGRIQGLVIVALQPVSAANGTSIDPYAESERELDHAYAMASMQELERVEELFRQQQALLDSVADGICGMDRMGAVTFVNPAAARLLGAPAAHLVGKSLHDLLHGSAPADHRCGSGCVLLRAAKSQMGAAGEDTLYRADGTAIPAEYFFTPILDEGKLSGAVLSFRDISQRYALDRMKDEFISTVSHELRTPLTSIRGALGLLGSGMVGEMNGKAAQLLRIALSNSERLVRLINDILDLERIQTGREPANFRKLQLADLVRDAIEGMQPMAGAAGVELVQEGVPVEITGDFDRLLQVLTNLLSNAIKFSEPASVVRLQTQKGASGVTLSVMDQGRGIPADKLEAIFGRFQQVDASDSRQRGGTGLGLAICRSIVTQHSGRIWAERNPEGGSIFRVYLPYVPAAHILAQKQGISPELRD